MANAPTADPVLASALRIAVMRLARRLRTERNDDTLTFTQLSALGTLYTRGAMSPTALAEYERVQPPSMTRVIALLESRGLVQRAPHNRDRRQSVIEITPVGTELLEADQRRREAWLTRALLDLSSEDQAILRAAAPLLEELSRS